MPAKPASLLVGEDKVEPVAGGTATGSMVAMARMDKAGGPIGEPSAEYFDRFGRLRRKEAIAEARAG